MQAQCGHIQVTCWTAHILVVVREYFSSQEDHCNARAQTVVGILDYDARRQGRERLQHSEMEDLPSLFRCEPNEGRDGEFASIKTSHLAEEVEVS